MALVFALLCTQAPAELDRLVARLAGGGAERREAIQTLTAAARRDPAIAKDLQARRDREADSRTRTALDVILEEAKADSPPEVAGAEPGQGSSFLRAWVAKAPTASPVFLSATQDFILAARSRRGVLALRTSDGQVAWEHGNRDVLYMGPPCVAGDRVFVLADAGTPNSPRLESLRLRSGAPENAGAIFPSYPALETDGTHLAYVAAPGKIRCLDTGQGRGREATAALHTGAGFRVAKGYLYFTAPDLLLRRLDLSGRTAAELLAPSELFPVATTSDGILAWGDRSEIVILSLVGSEWSSRAARWPTTLGKARQLLVLGNYAVVLMDTGALAGIDLRNATPAHQRVAWTIPQTAASPSAWTGVAGSAVAAAHGSVLVLRDAATGATLERRDLREPIQALSSWNERLIVATPRGFTALDFKR